LLVAGSGCTASATGSTGRTTPLGDVKPAALSGALTAAATTTQIADFVSSVGGDRLTVVSLLAANQDPHEFEPKPEDVQRLNSAAIVFKNGVGLERHFAKVLDNLPETTPIVDTSRGVRLRQQEGEDDPHIWHDPRNAEVMVMNIRDALQRRDPANAAYYAGNTTRYLAQLDELDARIRQLIDAVPPSQRKLVTNHDAFGYFTDAYPITSVESVIPNGNTTAEPKPGDTEDLIRKIRAQHVCAIFTESSVNPKLEQQLAADAGVKVNSNLCGDTLGPQGSDGDSYLKMEESNALRMAAGMVEQC